MGFGVSQADHQPQLHQQLDPIPDIAGLAFNPASSGGKRAQMGAHLRLLAAQSCQFVQVALHQAMQQLQAHFSHSAPLSAFSILADMGCPG